MVVVEVVNCPEGYGNDNSTGKCEKCGAGKYSEGGPDACIKCEVRLSVFQS